jgi:hypothetical protein
MRRDQLIHTGDNRAGGVFGQIVGDPQAVVQQGADSREQGRDFRHPRLSLSLSLGLSLGLGTRGGIVVVSCSHGVVTC